MRNGGFVRLLPEKKESAIEQKINVLHDIMQARAFEATLHLQQIDDDADVRIIMLGVVSSLFKSLI